MEANNSASQPHISDQKLAPLDEYVRTSALLLHNRSHTSHSNLPDFRNTSRESMYKEEQAYYGPHQSLKMKTIS